MLVPRVTNLVGDLPGYGPVWFDPRAIANVFEPETGKGEIFMFNMIARRKMDSW